MQSDQNTKVKQRQHNFLTALRSSFKQKGSSKELRACFVYYNYCSALLYRESITLKRKGFHVDIMCLRPSISGKIVSKLEGMNLYQIQSRPSAEKNLGLYFLRLALFFLKSLVFLTLLGPLRKYNLIHITAPPDIMVFTAVIPKLLGAKIILDIHDIGPEFFMRKLHVSRDRSIIQILKFLEKVSARFADHVITVTDLWKDKLVSRSVSPRKCTVLLNVPDEVIFQPVIHLNESQVSDHFNLYYHGSLEEHFGIDTLVRAMPFIKTNIPHVMLHIYGSGRLQETLEQMTRLFQLDGCVKFHGTVPFHDLPTVLKDADIGMVPTKGSVFSDQALSMKSLEYISLGIPIVVSKNQAHAYYFNDTMVKFFIPEDEHDLARSVIELYKDQKQRKILALNAKHFIRKNGWQHAKHIYLHVITSLINPEHNTQCRHVFTN